MSYKCPLFCLKGEFDKRCKVCKEFPLAVEMDDDFQKKVKNEFAEMIKEEEQSMPLFKELIPDIFYVWQSLQTHRKYKIARHSFSKNKTTYRFFNELHKLQKEKYKQGAYGIQITATELQVKRANQIMYAHDIGFDISWRDFDRWHLRGGVEKNERVFLSQISRYRNWFSYGARRLDCIHNLSCRSGNGGETSGREKSKRVFEKAGRIGKN
ncbi:MAG: hypothetical protein NC548_39065 [Lachnospiraceae bacterium]|nr:hypothetical protein [Lachnospiraceae bacterium]